MLKLEPYILPKVELTLNIKDFEKFHSHIRAVSSLNGFDDILMLKKTIDAASHSAVISGSLITLTFHDEVSFDPALRDSLEILKVPYKAACLNNPFCQDKVFCYSPNAVPQRKEALISKKVEGELYLLSTEQIRDLLASDDSVLRARLKEFVDGPLSGYELDEKTDILDSILR